MSLRNTLRLSLAALTLAGAAAAQLIPMVTVVNRGSAYDRAIGNSWLGGAVHAHALLETRNGFGVRQGQIDLDARANVNLLTRGIEVGEVAAFLRTRTEFGLQTRTGNYRVELLGYTISSQSFANTSTFARRTWNYNAFPVAPSASIPVGPFSVTVRGNVGARLTTMANFFLPTTAPSVTLAGDGQASGVASASVSFGIPGVSVGVGVQGRILDQTLAIWGTAHATSGITGTATYSLVPISLRLYAFVDTFLHTWTTTLTSWSSASVFRNLF